MIGYFKNEFSRGFILLILAVMIPRIQGEVKCLRGVNQALVFSAVSDDCCNVMYGWVQMGRSLPRQEPHYPDPHSNHEYCCGYKIPGLGCSGYGEETKVIEIKWSKQSVMDVNKRKIPGLK